MPEKVNVESPSRLKPGSLLLYCEICKRNTHNTEGHGGNGGARLGAGRKPGGMNVATVQRHRIRQAVIDRIHLNANTIVTAALSKALGEAYLVHKFTVGSGSKQRTEVEIVTDVAVIMDYFREALDPGEGEYYYITTKPVDIFAVKELLDRGFGKAGIVPEMPPTQEDDGEPAKPDLVAQFMEMAKGQTKK